MVDISENNLVEIVRDLRSSFGYTTTNFKALPLDVNSSMFDAFIESQENYDYVLNLSALKHVRSEKDPYTLMRLLEVNIFNAIKLARLASRKQSGRYFAVSTDKAANPVNLMGASKRIMEIYLMREFNYARTSMARFANVAFSDGSLLFAFNNRFLKKQPIVAPIDVRRYFVTSTESGQLCLMSTLFGENLDIYFPKENDDFKLTGFAEISFRYLQSHGYDPVVCMSEEEARLRSSDLISQSKWPVFLFSSDTTGEKHEEEFFTEHERINSETYKGIGIIKNSPCFNSESLSAFEGFCQAFKAKRGPWNKDEIVERLLALLPGMEYSDLKKYLDDKM